MVWRRESWCRRGLWRRCTCSSIWKLACSSPWRSGSTGNRVVLGRLKHGRHFTFKSSVDCAAVTFVVPTVIGAFANAEQPYAVQGSWLQVKTSGAIVGLQF
ncbi:hypothetical protein HPB47_007636 [Ixodes persulcatus]|uniref:Uncharacterized protein n=1 Tax=Ixodes persulcatus TaxID=34615 RepID=A0AC60P6W0_IXOPE|nr:hypothetical protein HPB47_007636 [Ixodes persulcatus]